MKLIKSLAVLILCTAVEASNISTQPSSRANDKGKAYINVHRDNHGVAYCIQGGKKEKKREKLIRRARGTGVFHKGKCLNAGYVLYQYLGQRKFARVGHLENSGSDVFTFKRSEFSRQYEGGAYYCMHSTAGHLIDTYKSTPEIHSQNCRIHMGQVRHVHERANLKSAV